jgi:hypothetical protein
MPLIYSLQRLGSLSGGVGIEEADDVAEENLWGWEEIGASAQVWLSYGKFVPPEELLFSVYVL